MAKPKKTSAPAPAFDPDAPAIGDGIYGLPFTADDAEVIVIPVPFEATTSYGGGTSRGPKAVLEASRQVDLYDHETGRPYESGIAMLDIPRKVVGWNRQAKAIAAPVIKEGGAVDRKTRAAAEKVNRIGEQVNDWVYDQTIDLLDQDKMAVILGGDHSVPFGAIRAYSERYPGLGILHLDAHADLRDAYEGFTWSHASIFHNVMTRLPNVAKLVQVGVRDLGHAESQMIAGSGGRIETFFDADLALRKDRGESFASIADSIVASLPETVYLSWDIDGLDPTLCPGTGTPVPGGLSWNEAIGLLRAIARSGKKIVGLDLCEVSPGETEWDANVGARLLYKMIGFALATRPSHT
ncbi:MAG TPA: agmatinase family protein [Thermoanaerobaculia bacterium]|nr:agmatinase family protein [Thermoanaerobaculia bacterium]